MSHLHLGPPAARQRDPNLGAGLGLEDLDGLFGAVADHCESDLLSRVREQRCALRGVADDLAVDRLELVAQLEDRVRYALRV